MSKKAKQKRICYIYIIVHRKILTLFLFSCYYKKKHSKEVTHNFAWSRFDLSPLWNFVQDTTWCSKIFLPLFFIDGIARIVSTEFCLCLSLTPHSPPGWPLRCARLHFKHQCISVFSTKMQEDIFFFQYTNHWCVKNKKSLLGEDDIPCVILMLRAKELSDSRQ